MREILVFTVTMCVALGLVVTAFDGAGAQEKPKANPMVTMKTTKGDITIELYPDKAPNTVANFLSYVDKKFYDGLIFHRVMANFMIQGGGFNKDMVRKEGGAAIQNEADNGLSNLRGTIAMARTGDPHSATSQFFINVKDNPALDFKTKNPPSGWGYCVFGKVIDGMDAVDKIRQVTVTTKAGNENVPVDPIVITKIYRLADDEIRALKAKAKPEKEKS
jgi:peptidyl-prolyl cis-trans isomerase B (cyclophilin B)